MYEGLINNLHRAADKWEKEHPIIGVGQLRVHDAIRDAARALKEADSKLEQVTLERDAAVADMYMVSMNACDRCKHLESNIKEGPCNRCMHIFKGTQSRFEWRGVMKEE